LRLESTILHIGRSYSAIRNSKVVLSKFATGEGVEISPRGVDRLPLI